MAADIKISVIIPNLHSPIVDQTIESVLAQKTEVPFEVIVVGMDKYDLVKQFKQIQYIKTPAPVGAAQARNIGIKKAKGDWLLFIDSDCVAYPDWINAFTIDFDQGWLVVGGGVKSPVEPFWRLVYNLSMFHQQLASKKRGPKSYLPTLNLGVHRKVIDQVGLLDENLLRGQDVDWTARMTLAGFPLLFDPEAIIEHFPERLDFEAQNKLFYKSGSFMITVRHRYPEIFHMPQILENPFIWKKFKPVIAALTTLKIILTTREVRQHYKTIPNIYQHKVSWCEGAADQLQQWKNERQ